MPVLNYRELVVWQKAMDLAELTYGLTRCYPKHELYGLASQSRQAVVSVASNIAEGQGRRSRKEFLHHLSIAHGSLREVETQVILAERLHYLQEHQVQGFMTLATEVGRLLNGLYNSLSPEGAA